jgi:hypothetical protein
MPQMDSFSMQDMRAVSRAGSTKDGGACTDAKFGKVLRDSGLFALEKWDGPKRAFEF